MSKSHWNWTSASCWFKLTVFCITAITTVKITYGGFACLENPCMHGICIDYLDVNSSSMCYCLNGYTGFHCQINWDECFHLNPCMNGGSCSDGIASFNCSCPEYFAGALCQYDLSACEEMCHNNGSCIIDSSSGNETISCLCQPGFVGSQCEVDISICNTTENALCLNGGICQDLVGEKFQCQCAPGWEGDICQKQIDNCASQPCSSGGICVNKLNDFACACPFGYTGKICEKKLKICEINPCKNGAFCLHEDEDETKKTCYCVPDYGGDLCESKYDDCSPAPRCNNGGTCIDGVGAFSCSCPPNFFGPTCQCTPENMTDPACQQNETETSTITTNYPVSATLPYSSITLSTKFPGQSELMSGISEQTIVPPSLLSLQPTSSSITPIDEGGDSTTITFFESETLILSSSVGTNEQGSIDSAKPFFPVSSSTIINFPMEASTITTILEPTISLEGSEGSIFPSSSLMSLFFTPTTSVASWPSVSFSEPEATESLIMPISSSSSPHQSITPGDLHSANNNWMSSSSFSSSLKLPEIDHSSNSIISTIPNSTSKPDGETGESLLTSNIFVTATVSESSYLNNVTIMSVTPNMTQTILVTATLPPTISSDLISSTEAVTEPSISYEFSTVELESSQAEFYSTLSLSTSTHFTVFPTHQLPFPNSSSITFSDKTELFSPIIITTIEIQGDSSTHFLTPTIPISHSTSLLASDNFFNISSVITPNFITTMIDVDATLTSSLPESETTLIFFPSLSSLETMIPDPTTSSSFVHLTTPEPSTSLTLPSPNPTHTTPTTTPPTQTEDPCHNYCRNNGKCISDSIQPICICSFKFSGNRCENPRKKFKTVSFTGDSFLEYKVPNDSINKINVKTMIATNAPDAILFYTASSKATSRLLYALIFTQAGHVSLHFSCGISSMHFVETRTRVDNGQNFTLEFNMEMVDYAIGNETEVHCIAQVSVNHSYIMRGEQIVQHNNELYENPIQFIYLGGVDSTQENVKKSDDLIRLMPGLRGCMYSLEINGESKDLYEDAIHGQQVAECSAFGCVTNPCFGQSKCIPSNKSPFWECICNPGFQGVRCHVRVCDSNPCLNGATCTFLLEETNENVSNNSTTTEITAQHPPQPVYCLCSLGFTGSQCQSMLNITKPSFKPFSGIDYSAYIAYEPIPRFTDWVQLKFHFVIRNYSQIALLLYSGYTQSLTTSSSISNPDDLDALTELLKEGVSGGSTSPGDVEDDMASTNNNEVGTGNKVSDFFAIIYVHGYVALTWNLGSGTQRIITPGRIDKRINVHTVFAGRSGRRAWIKVDGMRNITGKSPGPFHRLNVLNSELFLGGYESFRFEGLPHDLPMLQGFEGCIFDFGFRVKQRLYLPRALRGRNVKNCYEEDC